MFRQDGWCIDVGLHSEKAPGWSAARRVAPSDPYTGWRWSWAVVLADLQAWLDGAHAMTWQAAGVFMHSEALVDSPVEKMDLVPTAALQEARAMTQRIGVEAPRAHRGSRQWLQRWRRRRELRLRKFPVLEPLDERDMHGKASSQTNAKKTTHVSPPNKFWL